MTAEIAVLNREGVAIAADSAVTLREQAGQKIFTSANKIFALSKYQPVGIMVHGSADYMGIPWETIIKMYRNRLGDEKLDSLSDYVEDFVNFLSESDGLIPESEQDKYFRNNVYAYFRLIRREILESVRDILGVKHQISRDEVARATIAVIRRHRDRWIDAEAESSIPETQKQELLEKYAGIIEQAKKDVFEKLPVWKVASELLTEIAITLFVKFPEGIVHSQYSGVVIAGFGDGDVFPSLRSLIVEGIVNSRLKYKVDMQVDITFENDAAIVPFAQSEMVATFMEGVEPSYNAAIEKDLAEVFVQYPVVVVESIEKLDDQEKDDLKRKLQTVGRKMLSQYLEKLKAYRDTNFVDPIVRVVSALPKDELAAMAESLVNLTSFKRKVSMEAETVGGPVDVAVISKGDGFVWIRRKHYFKPELNYQFFANYYREARPYEA